MARKTNSASPSGHLLPLRFHSARGAQFPDANQPAQTLPAALRVRRTESAGVWAQPTPGRSGNHRCLTYLGTKARLPSPSSLHCHRRSVKSRWQRVALAQTAQVPLSRASACRAIPGHSGWPSGSANHAAEVAPPEGGILICEHVGLNVAECGLWLVLYPVVESLDDVKLEVLRSQ